MAMDKPSSFDCLNCGAPYQLVKAEAGPETEDRHVPCRACGALLPGRRGKFVLKYFALRRRP
jgi:DNA-directed RNA polymerase subunit RPC12/RpoP